MIKDGKVIFHHDEATATIIFGEHLKAVSIK